MIGILINSIAAFLLVLTGLLIVALALTISEQQKRRKPKRIYQVSLTEAPKPHPTNTGAPSPHLKMRLVSRLNGDTKAATRLVRHARQQNPGRSEIWYLEKVIFDLERDRH